MKMLSCQPHPQGDPVPGGLSDLWVSAASLAPLKVSGALSRAAAVFAHLEWLLVLCASGLFPTPISFCSFLFLFPAQLRSWPSAPPWALSTALQPGTCCCRHLQRLACGELVSCKGAMNSQLRRCLQGAMRDPVAARLPGWAAGPSLCPSTLQDSAAACTNDALLSTSAATALEGCAVHRNCHNCHKKPQPYI